MAGRRVALGEDAGALQHDIDPEILPGQILDRALAQHLDRTGATLQRVALEPDLAGEPAMHGIVAEQVGVGLGRGQIVDRDHADVAALLLDYRAQHIAADPAKAVDCHTNAHDRSPRDGFRT
jgi:hypothetical protein